MLYACVRYHGPFIDAPHGRYDYQLYFWEDRSIKELEADVQRTLTAFIRSDRPVDVIPGAHKAISTRNVRERGGVLVGLPKQIPPSSLLPPNVLREYVAAFKRKGFAGPLYWYASGHGYKAACSRRSVLSGVLAPDCCWCSPRAQVPEP